MIKSAFLLVNYQKLVQIFHLYPHAYFSHVVAVEVYSFNMSFNMTN